MRNTTRKPPTIPDHEVLRKIGGGAYGDIWMAQTVTGVLRAIKVIWRDDFDTEVDFEREFEGIMQYEPLSRSHPGLVPILHVGRAKLPAGDQFYYYVMELADDIERGQRFHPVEYSPRTLHTDLIAAQKEGGDAIDIDHCLEVGRLTAEGLDHLHQQELIHRDIKPSNIIYHAGVPKLADIGLVAPPGRNTYVGTQGFVPPEGPGSKQADLYALGKILYEMSTGEDRMDFPKLPECPFTGERAKRWRELNHLICDLCDPRPTARTVTSASALSAALLQLAEGQRFRRPHRLTRLLVVLIGLGLVGGICWWWGPSLVDQVNTAATQRVPLKVISDPIGAEVWTPEGEFLGTTPLASREVLSGEHLTYEFRLDGYATIRQDIVAHPPAVILEATLPVYAPPSVGQPWSDAVGMVYAPTSAELHTTSSYVTSYRMSVFQDATHTGEAPPPAYPVGNLKVNGVIRKFALLSEQQARQYCAKLTRLSIAQGRLTPDYEITPLLDHEVRTSNRSAEVRKAQRAPFRCQVRLIPYAQITLSLSTDTLPSIYIDGQPITYTTDYGRIILTGIKPGNRNILIETDGYRSFRKAVSVQESDNLALEIELKANNSVIFEHPWTNSLQLTLVPIHALLMAATHETTVAAYQTFCKETKHPLPSSPSYPQAPDHPVVNVSREDAVAFCKWLTKRERKRSLIGRNSIYRLPTDREWSRLAGLTGESGETPYERDINDSTLFAWGNAWPPPPRAGNFASQVGDTQPDRAIADYADPYVYTAPVGSFTPTATGLYDIAGNVYEWVRDDYGVGQYGVTRGASYRSYQPDNLYLKFRNIAYPDTANSETGFRIVLVKRSDPSAQ